MVSPIVRRYNNKQWVSADRRGQGWCKLPHSCCNRFSLKVNAALGSVGPLLSSDIGSSALVLNETSVGVEA